MKTHKLVLSAVICAAAAAFMMIGTVVKTGTLALYAVLSVMMMVIRAENGTRYALMSYFITGAMAAILPVESKIMLSFTCIFGIYPIIKAEAEKRSPVFRWIIKLAGFNICFAVFYFLLIRLVGNFGFGFAAVIIAVNIAFIIYDIILSCAYTFYVKNVRHLLVK